LKKTEIPLDLLYIFSNYTKQTIDNLANQIFSDLKKIWGKEITKPLYNINDEILLNYIRNYITVNKILFSWSVLYLSDKYRDNQKKANKYIYFLLLQNINFNIVENIKIYILTKNKKTKKEYKDIFIILFFSIIIAAILSYLFYTKLWQFLS